MCFNIISIFILKVQSQSVSQLIFFVFFLYFSNYSFAKYYVSSDHNSFGRGGEGRNTQKRFRHTHKQNLPIIYRSSVTLRVGESVESALSALAAIFLALSAYFNNFRQKIPYFDVSQRKRVLFDCFATKQCLGMLKM